MTVIYDPVSNHYKIEVDRMGYYTVSRQKPGSKYFNSDAIESKYLQVGGDTVPFNEALIDICLLPSNKRNWAYTELINSQFE